MKATSSHQHIPKQCLDRLKKEYMQIQKQGHHPNIQCCPLENNLLEWHYVIYQLDDKTPYHGGYYHGKVVFPNDYPYKPPSIYMITPNGRFKPNTRLCLSMSDFHPETWNPLWSVSSILAGLLSFMLEEQETFGSVQTTEEEKRKMALDSMNVNLKNQHFCTLFPELVQDYKKMLRCDHQVSIVKKNQATPMYNPQQPPVYPNQQQQVPSTPYPPPVVMQQQPQMVPPPYQQPIPMMQPALPQYGTVYSQPMGMPPPAPSYMQGYAIPQRASPSYYTYAPQPTMMPYSQGGMYHGKRSMKKMRKRNKKMFKKMF